MYLVGRFKFEDDELAEAAFEVIAAVPADQRSQLMEYVKNKYPIEWQQAMGLATKEGGLLSIIHISNCISKEDGRRFLNDLRDFVASCG